MTKDKIIKLHTTFTTIQAYMFAIVNVYLYMYIFNNINTSERAILTLVGCALGIVVSSSLRKQKSIFQLRKYLVPLSICIIIMQIVVGIFLSSNALIAGIINTIIGGLFWNITEGINRDRFNKVFAGEERTYVDNTVGMWNKIALFIGSSTVIIIDYITSTNVYIIALMSILATTFTAITDYITTKYIEKYLNI